MSELIDNTSRRVDDLASVVRRLHEGADPKLVKEDLARIVRSTTSEEIVAMEQQLLTQGVTVDQIKGMCDLHSRVVGELLQERSEAAPTPGHPAHTFSRENEAIGAVVARTRELLAELAAGDADPAALLPRWRELHEQLLELDKHYARKENLLFPCLERHGITGPGQVMWGKDDDVRVLMKGLREALAAEALALDDLRLIAERLAAPLLDQVEEMIRKEERILLPMSLQKLAPSEWAEIWRETPRFGSCLVEPADEWRPPEEAGMPEAAGTARADVAGAAGAALAQAIPVGVGRLTGAQLRGVLAALPVDLTFVDADDRVAFFSEGDRIFQRTPAIIGRKVQNCHPPQSVEVVQRILDDFRAGRQDLAEFWIRLHGRFVHIRYFAVRDDDGAYQGTLEVTQDLARLRRLEGERRLLQYGEAAAQD